MDIVTSRSKPQVECWYCLILEYWALGERNGHGQLHITQVTWAFVAFDIEKRGGFVTEIVDEAQHDKTNTMSCAPSEDSDQPGRLRSQIRVVAVRSKDSQGPNASSCGLRRQFIIDICLFSLFKHCMQPINPTATERYGLLWLDILVLGDTTSSKGKCVCVHVVY